MADQALADELRAFLDKQAILECMHRYARGVDRHDADLVRSAYHDDAVDDHVGFVGRRDALIDYAFTSQSGFARNQHFLTNHTADLDGDTAHCETYYMFVASPADPEKPLMISGGRYIDRFEKRAGEWKIADRVVTCEFQTNVPASLSAAAFQFASQNGTQAKDRSDISYERPLQLKRRAQAR
jgi:hypothetical protein